MRSAVCNFIRGHPDNWRELQAEKTITVKEDEYLAIFNYGLGADFTDDVVREARGIIIRMDTIEVVCWPFTKFMNAQEPEAYLDLDNFDWDHCECQEKIDGSIVKLFFNPFKNGWQWATNSCISAADANLSDGTKGNYLEIITQTDNYKEIKTEDLDKNVTYIFELVSPQTQVVINYPYPHLYQIGQRNNITGLEETPNIEIDKPKLYPLNSLDDCIAAANMLNDSNEHSVTKEGFVLVDRSWHRIKVKSPKYVELHRAKGNILTKGKIINLIRECGYSAEELCDQFPAYSDRISFYDCKMKELEEDIDAYIYVVREIYYGHKKRYALAAKNDKYKAFGFAALDNSDLTAKDMLANMPRARYEKLIEDYKNEG